MLVLLVLFYVLILVWCGLQSVVMFDFVNAAAVSKQTNQSQCLWRILLLLFWRKYLIQRVASKEGRGGGHCPEYSQTINITTISSNIILLYRKEIISQGFACIPVFHSYPVQETHQLLLIFSFLEKGSWKSERPLDFIKFWNLYGLCQFFCVFFIVGLYLWMTG